MNTSCLVAAWPPHWCRLFNGAQSAHSDRCRQDPEASAARGARRRRWRQSARNCGSGCGEAGAASSSIVRLALASLSSQTAHTPRMCLGCAAGPQHSSAAAVPATAGGGGGGPAGCPAGAVQPPPSLCCSGRLIPGGPGQCSLQQVQLWRLCRHGKHAGRRAWRRREGSPTRLAGWLAVQLL